MRLYVVFLMSIARTAAASYVMVRKMEAIISGGSYHCNYTILSVPITIVGYTLLADYL